MQLIHCTQKLLKEMGLKKSDLPTDSSPGAVLGPWHANLLYIDRRKCILLANDKTLFNFIVPDLKKEHIRQLDALFPQWLQCILAEEGFDEAIRDKIMVEYRDIGFASTHSRVVLGSMNDLAFHYKIQIESAGGVHSYMIPQIIRQLNRMSMKPLGYGFPIYALRDLYGLQKAH